MSAGHIAERNHLVTVIRSLQRSVETMGGISLGLIRSPSYDETPMSVKVRDNLKSIIASIPGGADLVDAVVPMSAIVASASNLPMVGKTAHQTGVAKILNTMWRS